MNVTSVRPLNQMAQEGDQEVLIWGETTEMIVVVAEGAMIGVATEAEEGTVGASEGAGVVGTEVVSALARWTPGVSTDGISGRGRTSLAPEALEQLSSCTQCYYLHYFVIFHLLITQGFFVSDYVTVTIPLVPIKNHHFS